MPSVLNVGGHPKDCLIYSGGTAAKHAARGDKVTNLAVTHGVRWTHWRAIDRLAEGEKPDFETLIEEKRNEFTAASNELGVTDVRFMGLDDEVLLVERDTIDKIADIIEEIKPDIIITHWPYDSVMTHANATLMVLQALDAVSGMRGADPANPHYVKQIFYHTSLGSMNAQENQFPRTPTVLVNVTDVAKVKERAINKLDSQFYSESKPDHWRKTAEIVDSIGGAFARVPYAEAFVAQYPSFSEYLPVAEESLYSSGTNYEEMFDRIYRFPLND